MDREYQPVSFKDVLIEMKDISELMVDLAYSAILFDSTEIALEVMNLEESMNKMVYQARIQSILGSRRVEEAESMSGLLQVAEAAEKISNSASDVAKLIIKKVKFPAKLKEVLPDAEEVTVRVVVHENSGIDGQTLGGTRLQSSTGMRVIAIRRDTSWTYDPDKNTHVVDGAILIAKGPKAGIRLLKDITGSTPETSDEKGDYVAIEGIEGVVSLLVEMKNISELSVGLAYSSLLFNNKEVAHEVVSLDARVDAMRHELDLWILESAKKVIDVSSLRGLLYMSSFAENISNAAHAIVDVILRDIEIPPVFRKIIRESDEIITLIKVKQGSALIGKSPKDTSLCTVTGMVVLAIKSGDRWTYRPERERKFREGDIIIAKGRRDGECRLYEMAGSVKATE